MKRNYVLEIGDVFFIHGAPHEVCGEFTLTHDGRVYNAGGTFTGYDMPLYHSRGSSNVLVKAQSLVDEMTNPGSNKEISFVAPGTEVAFVYPGDPNHIDNRNVMATIFDAKLGSATFDASIWFKTVGTAQVRELHEVGFTGPLVTKILGAFYRPLNPRIGRFFEDGVKPEISVDCTDVERLLSKTAPQFSQKLFSISREEVEAAAAGNLPRSFHPAASSSRPPQVCR
jgi:hypothetical protein